MLSQAQSSAFGGRDATGVEAVKDVMPTEMTIFDRLICKAEGKTGRWGMEWKAFGHSSSRSFLSLNFVECFFS